LDLWRNYKCTDLEQYWKKLHENGFVFVLLGTCNHGHLLVQEINTSLSQNNQEILEICFVYIQTESRSLE